MPWASPPCTWPSVSSGFTSAAVVVHRLVAQPARPRRVRVDLHLGDVGAAGEGEEVRRVVGLRVERRATCRPAGWPGRARRAASASQVHAASGARHGEPARGEGELAGRRLQQVRGEAAAPVEHRVHRQHQGGAAHVQRAGAAMAVAARDRRRVGLHQPEALDRQAEPVGGDLGEAGLVPLAVRLRAEGEVDRCRRRRSAPPPTRPASPARFPGSRRGRGRAACRALSDSARRAAKPARSASARRASRASREAAAVHGDAEGAAVREGGDEVAPAQRRPGRSRVCRAAASTSRSIR